MKPPEVSEGADVGRTVEMLLRGALLTSMVCLVAGLALWLIQGDPGPSEMLLRAGLVLLMSTPVLRVMSSAVEAVRSKDWFQLATIATVTGLLGLSLTYALARL